MLNTARLRGIRAAVLVVGAALALGFSLPAGATRTDSRSASPQDATTRSQSGAASNPGRVICVRTQLTGSRLNRRICRTERQWEEDGEVPTER